MQLVSIITPTFNHEKFIGDCIESVMVQTYPYWEMIIIDDGSTDGTEKAASLYKDKRIRYIKQENKGINRLYETYNTALSMARGDYIAILEGDDYWPHYKLKVQVDDFKDKNVVLSFGYTQIVADDDTPLHLIPHKDLPSEARLNTPVGRASIYMMDPKNLTYTFPVSVVIRKAALERMGGFQQPPCLPLVDYPTFLQLSMEGPFAFHNKILGFWRRHDQSITKNKFYLILDGVREYIKLFQNEKGAQLPATQKEIEEINRQWNRFEAIRCLVLGRWHLVDREWREARNVFKNGLASATEFRLLTALGIGIVFSYMRMNMEFLFRMRRIPTIAEMLLSGKDMIVDK